MKMITLILAVILLGCNDSATVEKPVRDNAINKDTTAKDTSVLQE